MQQLKATLARCADRSRLFIIDGFRSAVPNYAMALPLFLILAVTQQYAARDAAGTVLNFLPMFWVCLIGGHCLLFLIFDKPTADSGARIVPDALVQEQIHAFALDADKMATVYAGVLNKNALPELSTLPPLTILPPGARLTEEFRSFAMTKFAAVAVFVIKHPELPIAIDLDASILIELGANIHGLGVDEVRRLHGMAMKHPTFCRFYLAGSSAEGWPLPMTPTLTPIPYTAQKNG